MSFVQKYRLRWPDVEPSPAAPFTDPEDYKILYNDWPYGLDPDIVHLVVWTKFVLEDDPATDRLTARARREIEDFVIKTFCGVDGIPRERLVWFKNWKSLKSIHALGKLTALSPAILLLTSIEHFHVMLYRPSNELIETVTNGDQPTSVTMKE